MIMTFLTLYSQIRHSHAFASVSNLHATMEQLLLEAAMSTDKEIGFVAADFEEGQCFKGSKRTPAIFRSNYFHRLEEEGWKFNDAGELPFPEDIPGDSLHLKAKLPRLNGGVNHVISDATYDFAKDPNKFVLTVGGDHAIAFGSIHGVLKARPDTVVFWVDAHADINTPLSSISGNMHGMPAAAHLGLFDFASMPGWSWFESKLKVKDLIYIGLRDLDIFEKTAIKKLGIQAYTIHDIERMGIATIMRQSLESVADRNIHLTFDIDSLDPMYAPSTGTISEGGLSYREATYIVSSLAATGRLHSMDLVEINPSLKTGSKAHSSTTIEFAENEELHPNAQKTLDLGWALIEHALGKTLL